MSDATLHIPLYDIEIGERVGFFHADHAAGIADSFLELGQTTPIEVCRNPEGAATPWRLVAGRHRISAAELLGWSEIEARQVADASASEARLLHLELSENLDRRSYRPLERAIFIEAAYQVADAMEHGEHAGENPHQRSIRLRWKNAKNQRLDTVATIANVSNEDAAATIAAASNWLKNLAASMGVKDRTLRSYREIYRAIVVPFPDLTERLNFHQIGARLTYIHGIAKLDREETRRKVIETIIADPELDGLKSALIKCGAQLSNGNRSLPQDRASHSFHRGWEKMTLLQQEANAARLAQTAHLRVARKMYAELKKRRGIEGGDNG